MEQWQEVIILKINELVIGEEEEVDREISMHDRQLVLQYIEKAKLTANDCHSLLIKTVLPCRRYGLVRDLLCGSSLLYEKVIREISGYSIENCIRVLITMADDNLAGSKDDVRENFVRFDRYKRLLHNMAVQVRSILTREKRSEVIKKMKEILAGVAQYALEELSSFWYMEPFLNVVPDFDVNIRFCRQYFPCTFYENNKDISPFTLLLTAILQRNDMVSHFLLKREADPNFPTPLGVTPLMASCYMNNVSVYKMLLAHGANRHLCDNKGHTFEIYALRRHSTAILYEIAKSGHRLAPRWVDKKGYSRLMLWLMGERYLGDTNTASSVFGWIMRNENACTLEWLNKDGDSFVSLYQRKPNISDRFLKHFALKIKQVRSTSSGRWICPFNTKNVLTLIVKKMQIVIKKKGLDKCKSHHDLEFIRLFRALAVRFPLFFVTLFNKTQWKNITEYCNRSPRLLIHMICYPPSDKNKKPKNKNNPFVNLSHDVFNRIFSYLPYALSDRRLDVETLHKQLTEEWSNLFHSKTVHWIKLGGVVSSSSCNEQQDKDDNNLYYERYLCGDSDSSDDSDDSDSVSECSSMECPLFARVIG